MVTPGVLNSRVQIPGKGTELSLFETKNHKRKIIAPQYLEGQVDGSPGGLTLQGLNPLKRDRTGRGIFCPFLKRETLQVK